MSEPLCPDCGQVHEETCLSRNLRRELEIANGQINYLQESTDADILAYKEQAAAAERERDEARDALKSLALELAADHGAALKTLINERDAAQAEAERARRHTTSIQRQYEATNELFSGLAKQLAKAQAEIAALRKALEPIQSMDMRYYDPDDTTYQLTEEELRQIQAALATPSTAGERIETDIFEHVRRGMGCIGIPQAQLEAMERVCAIAYQINRSVDSAELWDALSDALGNLGEMVDLNAHAALEKGE